MIHAAQGRREVSLMSLEKHRWKKEDKGAMNMALLSLEGRPAKS